jgi:uncharacterized membrane protein YeaQ/YmgE (transglycosylase-associated protein family)
LVGLLAGQIMRGGGFGILGNIAVGVVGAIIGGWIFGLLGLGDPTNVIGSIITAVVGAVVLLAIAGFIRR